MIRPLSPRHMAVTARSRRRCRRLEVTSAVCVRGTAACTASPHPPGVAATASSPTVSHHARSGIVTDPAWSLVPTNASARACKWTLTSSTGLLGPARRVEEAQRSVRWKRSAPTPTRRPVRRQHGSTRVRHPMVRARRHPTTRPWRTTGPSGAARDHPRRCAAPTCVSCRSRTAAARCAAGSCWTHATPRAPDDIRRTHAHCRRRHLADGSASQPAPPVREPLEFA
jgi:hypothetical protein